MNLSYKKPIQARDLNGAAAAFLGQAEILGPRQINIKLCLSGSQLSFNLKNRQTTHDMS